MATEPVSAPVEPVVAPAEPKFASQVGKEARAEYGDTLKEFAGKDVTDLFVEHAKLSKKVRERGIIIPTKDSPPEEVDEFHARMGLPKTAAEYKFTVEDGVLPPEAIAEAQQFAHANGYTSKQAQAYVGRLEAIVKSARGSVESRKAQGEAKLMENLTREMGGDATAAEGARNLAVKYISTNFSPAVAQKLIDSGMAYDPQYIKEAAAAQAKLEPRHVVHGDGGEVRGPGKEKSPGRQGNYSPQWNDLYAKKVQ
jgi:hypothetical protein